jgi:hypothetical protein
MNCRSSVHRARSIKSACTTRIGCVRCATFAIAAIFSTREHPMKPAYDFANTTALRPTRRGPAACGLLHHECGMGFIPHD